MNNKWYTYETDPKTVLKSTRQRSVNESTRQRVTVVKDPKDED